MYRFPVYDIAFSFPVAAAQILAVYSERESLKMVYMHRWAGNCWHWLSYMSKEAWFSDAMCYCLSAPWVPEQRFGFWSKTGPLQYFMDNMIMLIFAKGNGTMAEKLVQYEGIVNAKNGSLTDLANNWNVFKLSMS